MVILIDFSTALEMTLVALIVIGHALGEEGLNGER